MTYMRKDSKKEWLYPSGTSGKEPSCQCRRCKRWGFSPWVRKIPWTRHGNPLEYSCLEDPMDRGAWWAIVNWVTKSWTCLKQLMHMHMYNWFTLLATWNFHSIVNTLYSNIKKKKKERECTLKHLCHPDPLNFGKSYLEIVRFCVSCLLLLLSWSNAFTVFWPCMLAVTFKILCWLHSKGIISWKLSWISHVVHIWCI